MACSQLGCKSAQARHVEQPHLTSKRTTLGAPSPLVSLIAAWARTFQMGSTAPAGKKPRFTGLGSLMEGGKAATAHQVTR